MGLFVFFSRKRVEKKVHFGGSAPVLFRMTELRINTIMQFNGAGHIDLTSEDYPGGDQKSWDYDWDEMNPSVHSNVSINLNSLGPEGLLKSPELLIE